VVAVAQGGGLRRQPEGRRWAAARVEAATRDIGDPRGGRRRWLEEAAVRGVDGGPRHRRPEGRRLAVVRGVDDPRG
jgi:hypothetical protein